MQLLGLFGSSAPWLLLAFLGQHVTLSFGRRGADSHALSHTVDRYSGRGKFSSSDQMQCTWSSRYTTESVTVRVKCEDPEARIKGGVTDMQCEYIGKPDKCPGFQSKPREFWRQVGRSFRKLKGRVCMDQQALVRAGMCRRAPKDAHFKLDIRSSVASAQSGDPDPPLPPATPISTPTATNAVCPSRHQKTAEEYCNSQWASVCAFLLSVVQREDC